IGTGLAFGLVPALQAGRFDVQRGLRENARGMSSSERQTKLRASLVVAEVALACVLLIGAGLMMRSFINLLRMDPGFHAHQALTATISLPRETYKDAPAISQFFSRALEEWKNLPGVQVAGVGTDLPWTGYDDNLGGWKFDDRVSNADSDSAHARY